MKVTLGLRLLLTLSANAVPTKNKKRDVDTRYASFFSYNLNHSLTAVAGTHTQVLKCQ